MDFGTFAVNVGAAFGLGVLIGFERELRNHEAGLRTNALVALGAGLFVSLSRLCNVEGDSTRIAGQIVTPDGALHKFVNVYVNDDDVRYIGKLEAPVKAGDVVSILPAVAGGA